MGAFELMPPLCRWLHTCDQKSWSKRRLTRPEGCDVTGQRSGFNRVWMKRLQKVKAGPVPTAESVDRYGPVQLDFMTCSSPDLVTPDHKHLHQTKAVCPD